MKPTTPSMEDRLRTLEKTLRRDRRLALTSAVLLCGLLGLAWQSRESGDFDQLRAQRLDIVDAQGRRRLVLACAERFPLPVLKGKEWPRSIAPAGMVFYRADGDECGGMAMAEVGEARKNMLILDYSNSEAVGIGVAEAGAAYSAGLTLVERMPLDADVARVGTSGPERAALSNEAGSVQLRLADALGRPRIRIHVEPEGEAGIELLDESGELLEHWP